MTLGNRRALFGAAAFVLGSLGTANAFANTMAFEDNKLSFKTCDGAAMTVRWLGDDFNLSVAGKAIGPARATFQAVDWDGKCQTVSWNKDKSTFDIESGNETKPGAIFRYVAHDGARWVGMRDGDGFFVTLIAKEGETASPEKIADVSGWLGRKSDRYTPGAAMAKYLKVVTSP